MSSVTRTVFYREISAALFSPIRYLYFGAYFAISSSLFLAALQFGEGKFWTIQVLWLVSAAIPLPVLISLITMPLIAGERSAGTYESLSMLAIPMRKVIVGKFVASYLASCFAIIGSLVPWLLISHTLKQRAPELATLHIPLIFLFLYAFSWTALGTLSTSLSKRPWMAAVGTLGIGCALMFIWAAASHFWLSGNILSSSFPIITEMLDAAGGHISLQTIVFHIAFALWCLFTASQLLEARQ